MIYVYGPAGDVAHWRQELEGTLPRAGREAPPLPAGARPQRTASHAGNRRAGMETHTIGIILNGVTGRMGANQHLLRSIVPIISRGACAPARTPSSCPSPCWSGATPSKLEAAARAAGLARWTTDLDSALSDPRMSVYFDAQTTLRRAQSVAKAIEAGKHVYCEKPAAASSRGGLRAVRAGPQAGGQARRGAGQAVAARPAEAGRPDRKGFFGRILSVRGEFGYWVFEGDTVPAQRPSWNYRSEEGGGIILDMFCHWRYVLDNLFGRVKAVSCLAATHIPERWDEGGRPYRATADDAAYGTLELEGGIIAHQLLLGGAGAPRRPSHPAGGRHPGLRGGRPARLLDPALRRHAAPGLEPRPPQPHRLLSTWQKLPDQRAYDNAFKAQWELFLRHVALDEPFRWDLLEGARGVQLAELALESSRMRRWVDVPELDED